MIPNEEPFGTGILPKKKEWVVGAMGGGEKEKGTII
jgi:hypothetical protein